jgi:hypothetical protein
VPQRVSADASEARQFAGSECGRQIFRQRRFVTSSESPVLWSVIWYRRNA